MRRFFGVCCCAVWRRSPQPRRREAERKWRRPPIRWRRFVKGAFKSISTNLIGSAEQMPEANYSMKLGTMPEVRTFGQLIGHVVNANYFYCAMAKGEADPQTADYEKTAQTKDQLVRAMHAAIEYCGTIYDSLTDAAAMKMVTPQTPNGPGRPALLVGILMRNVGHNNEEYGNLVGYFRAANLVPPSTAAASGGRRGD